MTNAWLYHLRVLALAASMLAVLSPSSARAEPIGEGMLLMTPYKWSGLTDGQRALYIKSFLETTSFAMYRRDLPDAAQRDFSAWTLCAESKPIQSWQPLGWMIKGELKRTAASQFTEMASTACAEFRGKDPKKRSPVQLVSRKEWQSLGLRDRAIYVMGYIETVYEAGRAMKLHKEVRYLDICLGHQGIDGVLAALETTEMEWQYPIPWSISRVLGKACRPYRE